MFRTNFAMLGGLAIMAASGCIYVEDEGSGPKTVVTNSAPVVSWADGGCYWDSYYYDDIWYFEADVSDADSVYDVVAVYADVYDSWDGSWADSFELYPTNDPYLWYSDWLGSSTYLSCAYGDYVVDIVAYDSLDAYDIYSFAPLMY